MIPHLYRIECLTNLHVGNGDVNYSIIDNEVQRDAVLTDTPIIHSSGVKGALRQHFKDDLVKSKVDEIFGADGKDGGETTPGVYKFFDAFCLARPLRITSTVESGIAYVPGVSFVGLQSYLTFLHGVGITRWNIGKDPFSPSNGDAPTPGTNGKDKLFVKGVPGQVWVEGNKAVNANRLDQDLEATLTALVGPTYALAPRLDDYALPMIARNYLETGISQNVWYEEFVPHSSIFYTVIMTPGKTCDLDFSAVIQFGGNASVGYGYCHMEEVCHG